MLNVYLSLSPLDPLSPPGRGIERTREVLCLAGNLAIAELHDANRVDWPLIVADHVLIDPQVAASEHCIGYFGHPFVKLSTRFFTTLLFFFVM
jgi:hypothetical protein